MWGSTPELMGDGRCWMLRLCGVRPAVSLGIGEGERDAAVIPLADAEMKRSLPVSCDELSEVF